jgi:hypothetical protein
MSLWDPGLFKAVFGTRNEKEFNGLSLSLGAFVERVQVVHAKLCAECTRESAASQQISRVALLLLMLRKTT